MTTTPVHSYLCRLQQHNGPTPIDQLQSMGINSTDIEKLKGAGLYTVEAVSCARLEYNTAIDSR